MLARGRFQGSGSGRGRVSLGQSHFQENKSNSRVHQKERQEAGEGFSFQLLICSQQTGWEMWN